MDKLLTREDMTEWLGISHQTLLNWRKERGLPYYKFGNSTNGAVRYDRVKVQTWLDSQQRTTT